ncbi:MAG TPA: ABC transporter substrate-binding protein [Bryobacteraceae bacterium]|nr:ABC transporter substrate-binding protein [Bryobacteraceae bacterium]
MRVVSLLASGTEIVCALGSDDALVGRSHECDNPPWVRSLPPCSEPAFDITVSSREIDAEVNRRIRSGEPLYRLHYERIRDLTPDLIIAQAHCEVCAVTPGDVERSGCAVPGSTVLALTAGSLEGIFEGILQVARALGKEETGRALVCRERARLQAVRERTAGLRHPSVVMLEWTDPIFPMGNWGPELVEIAGGELLLGNKAQHSAAIPSQRVWEADPEVLIVAPCGFNLERALKDRAVLEAYPWWKSLRAVQNGKIAFADGNLFFNRSGMTISQTAEILAEILHGAEFGEASRNVHWRWA